MNNLVTEIERIIIRRGQYSLEDGLVRKSQFEILCNGSGTYLSLDKNEKIVSEKKFSVPPESFEKLCIRLINIIHSFDRIDVFYDAISEEVVLVFKNGTLTIPRGMGAKKKDVALIVQRFLNRYVLDQLKA